MLDGGGRRSPLKVHIVLPGQVDPIRGVDVHDDYLSEKTEVEGRGKKLSLNAYLVKCILGPKFAKWDNMDEDAGCKCIVM